MDLCKQHSETWSKGVSYQCIISTRAGYRVSEVEYSWLVVRLGDDSAIDESTVIVLQLSSTANVAIVLSTSISLWKINFES